MKKEIKCVNDKELEKISGGEYTLEEERNIVCYGSVGAMIAASLMLGCIGTIQGIVLLKDVIKDCIKYDRR